MFAVEFHNISKRFGNFFANKDISLSIKQNTVHSILGENGAGKSTLMKILFGIYKPDYGIIKIHDKTCFFKSSHDAIGHKIGMLHQHFMLIDDFTVLENVILGNELTKIIKIDYSQVRKILNEIIEKYNLGINLDKKIEDISVSEQQKVELLKLLYRNSEIIIFDEPTAVLSPVEVKHFYEIVGRFKTEGKTIIFITHKLNEVKEISDRISVLRKGMLVFESDNNDSLDISELSKEIVGDVNTTIVAEKHRTEPFKVSSLILENLYFIKNKTKKLDDLNLSLKYGRIHGIAGVEGNGQNELVDIICGIEENYSGVNDSNKKNISLVPDDRIKKGMIKEFSAGENFILKKEYGKKLITKKEIQKINISFSSDYDVRAADINLPMSSLSGGNQQKAIFGREMKCENNLVVLYHPTRGVDINATDFIHSEIINMRNNGKSILLISSDLDELLKLSDYISVIYKGKILKTFDISKSVPDDIVDEIGKLMLGIES
jgi:simple sugar transport system ATP-binding protein